MKTDRKFIRHPSEIPIKFTLSEVAADKTEYLRDISLGGLSFRSKVDIPLNSHIAINIPIANPKLKIPGIVVWSKKHKNHFDVGVEFNCLANKFQVRMLEQICYMEEYKQEILEKEGRVLTSEEAAIEWIAKYAADFPELK